MKNHLHCIFNCETVNLKTYSQIADIETIWNNFLPEESHLNSRNLAFYENSKIDEIEFEYVLIHNKKNELIGLAYLQILNFNAKHFNHQLLNQIKIEKIRNFVLQRSVPLIICGNLFKLDFQGFYIKNKSHNSLILKALKTIAKKKSASGILIKDSEIEFSSEELKEERFKHYLQDISMKLEITWNSFEEYLASLSRKYLQRAKKIIDAKTNIEVKTLDNEEVKHYLPKIENLYLEVVNKQDLKMGLLTGAYFLEMLNAMGNKFKINGYFIENELVAFASYFFYNEQLEIHYVGFDYEKNTIHKIYFNILFDAINEAIVHKTKVLHFGRTALDAKASVGATPKIIQNYVWIKMGIATMVYNFFFKKFQQNQGAEWENRKPFKVG